MDKSTITEEKFHVMYQRLLRMSQEFYDNENMEQEVDTETCETFSLLSETGKAFYDQLTDEMLLNVLRNRAQVLGTSPSQKEVFWIWKDYIKQRFKKWPYALRTAGLPASAGNKGKSLEQFEKEKKYVEKQLETVRKQAMVTGRIPHPHELPEVCENLKKYMKTWGQVIKAAGIQDCLLSQQSVYRIDDLEDDYRQMLDTIKQLSMERGRAPLHDEVDREMRQKLIERCSSWRNALYQIGLEPVMRITPFSSTDLVLSRRKVVKKHKNTLYDCYYRVLNLTDEAKADLEYLQQLSETLKRMPTKKEVPPYIVKRLIQTCGSWTNVLFQLRYHLPD